MAEVFEAHLEQVASKIPTELRQPDGRPIPLHLIEPKLPVGRPTLYTSETVDEICRLLRKGKSLSKIAKEPNMPSRAKILEWLGKHEDFRDRYVKAKQLAAEAAADEVIDIADEGRAEEAPKTSLRIKARQWTASRLLPQRWGEKSTVTHQIQAEDVDQTAICRRMAYLLEQPREPSLGESKPVIEAVEPPNDP